MTELAPGRVSDLLDQIRARRIMVVGDVMLDRYLWGRVSRVSPEAPVPVVAVDEEAVRLGGAANVAANVASLGAEPLLVGLVGAGDPASHELNSLLKGYGLPTDGLVEDADRRTTVKTRIIAHHQHVVRADREDVGEAEGQVAADLAAAIRKGLERVDGVILQDYNKGTLSSSVLREVLPYLRESGLPVTVDPKFERFFEYQGVTVFKPNLREVEAALGTALTDDESVAEAAYLLRHRLEAQSVLITRGERGMTLLEHLVLTPLAADGVTECLLAVAQKTKAYVVMGVHVDGPNAITHDLCGKRLWVYDPNVLGCRNELILNLAVLREDAVFGDLPTIHPAGRSGDLDQSVAKVWLEAGGELE